MNFEGKNVKRITPIMLPNGRPGVHVVYTEREPEERETGERTPGFKLPRMPWEKQGMETHEREGREKNADGRQRRTFPRAYTKNIKRGVAVGAVITALYLFISSL
jgi:hypothetical protein